MAEQTLSQEELKALLDDENAPKRTHQVVDYDFAHPTRLTRDQNKALTRAQQAAAAAIAADLCAAVRSPLQAASAGISEVGFAGLRASLPNPTVLYVLSAPPLPERGLLVVEPKIAFALVDRLLGGPGKAPSPLRPLTALERGLLDGLVKKALERIAAAWKDIAAFTPAIESLAMDPAEVDAIPSGETLVCAAVSITGEGEFAGGEITFCLPYVSLEPSLAKLGRPTKFAATKSAPTADQRRQIDQVLGKARLGVRVELGTATLTIGEILAMTPGDVIVLDQGPKDLIPGTIGGKRRFLGRSGKLGAKLAVLVEKALPRTKD